MTTSKSTVLIPADLISRNIYFLRDSRVMLDADLARLYGVTTANLNKAVNRNLVRFPEDFLFQVTKSEANSLIFQSGISKPAGRGGSRHLPYAFTEQGVAMLSGVLRSERAVKVNIAIMRVFVRLREMLTSDQQLRRKIEEMEKTLRRQIPNRFRCDQAHAASAKAVRICHRFSRRQASQN